MAAASYLSTSGKLSEYQRQASDTGGKMEYSGKVVPQRRAVPTKETKT